MTIIDWIAEWIKWYWRDLVERLKGKRECWV